MSEWQKWQKLVSMRSVFLFFQLSATVWWLHLSVRHVKLQYRQPKLTFDTKRVWATSWLSVQWNIEVWMNNKISVLTNSVHDFHRSCLHQFRKVCSWEEMSCFMKAFVVVSTLLHEHVVKYALYTVNCVKSLLPDIVGTRLQLVSGVKGFHDINGAESPFCSFVIFGVWGLIRAEDGQYGAVKVEQIFG